MSEFKSNIEKIKAIKAVDSHCLINFGHPFDSTLYRLNNMDYLRRTWGDAYNTVIVNKQKAVNNNYDYLRQMENGAGVEIMVASAFAATIDKSAVNDSNAYMLNLARSKENLYIWAVIDPNNKASFNSAREILESGKGVGIELLPKAHGYSLAEFGNELFAFASEYKTNVLLTLPEGEGVLEFANRYPAVNFIVAGAAFSEIEAADHKNIYTDTSKGVLDNAAFENKSDFVYSRLLFASNSIHAGAYRGRIEYSELSDENKEKILRLNAERIFGKHFNK